VVTPNKKQNTHIWAPPGLTTRQGLFHKNWKSKEEKPQMTSGCLPHFYVELKLFQCVNGPCGKHLEIILIPISLEEGVANPTVRETLVSPRIRLVLFG
jgi:hypothetical protein